jgi:hypothetical protein
VRVPTSPKIDPIPDSRRLAIRDHVLGFAFPFLSGGGSYLSAGGSYLSDGVSYLSAGVSYLSDSGSYLSDGVSYLSAGVSYLSDSGSYLSEGSSYLSDGSSYLSKELADKLLLTPCIAGQAFSPSGSEGRQSRSGTFLRTSVSKVVVS